MSDTADQSKPPVEQDAPPTVRIFAMMALLTVTVVVIVFGLYKAFTYMVRDQIFKRELSLQSKELLEQRAMDRKRLTQYALINKEEGIYQIPIQRAMEKLLENPGLMAPSSQPTATQPASMPVAPTKKGVPSKPDSK